MRVGMMLKNVLDTLKHNPNNVSSSLFPYAITEVIHLITLPLPQIKTQCCKDKKSSGEFVPVHKKENGIYKTDRNDKTLSGFYSNYSSRISTTKKLVE